MYRRLNREKREIRLIRISFDDQSEDGPLSLQLEHHQHGETPYVALSYVWGDPDNQVAIFVNKIQFSILQNLYHALERLRQQRTEGWVWVDAICIDQANDDEKSWEVNRMREVFQKAETVYHWLGPEADDSDFLLDWAAEFGREAFRADMLGFAAKSPNEQEECLLRFLGEKHPDLAPKPISRGPSSSDMSSTHKTASFLVQLAIQDPPDLSSTRMNKAMDAFLRRSFFQRLWIVQELAVSRHSVFLCGNRRLPVDHIESVLALTGRRLWGQTILHDVKANAHPGATNREWLRDFNRNLIDIPALELRRRRLQGHYSSLFSILELGIGVYDMPMLVAADPRDIVFGVLGVSCNATVLNLSADYSKSTIHVFTAVTRAFIRHCIDYRLGYSFFPKNLDGLPSWVPDWPRLCREGVPYFPVSRGYPQFKASLNTQQPPEHLVGEVEDSPTLLLSGFRLGSIASVLDTQLIFCQSRGGILNTSTRFIFDERETVTLTNEVQKFCYEKGITKDETIIRTCLMDDITLHGICARTNRTFLGIAQKTFHGQECIEEDLKPEDMELLSQYEDLKYQ
ncbi:heterokaryon incompatibility protein-domain-containing protein [Rhypophila decipiens]|uniref:Heterokaryon incompatibility protein-domain-containing protein n=1 Tax=Rhypophila decipiens TaxID=261697 RepID=A0AAN6XXU9_9PEZI|nr:heterokaryon incompatibility protein-domain-containing protein [Rhypophila decipiens]